MNLLSVREEIHRDKIMSLFINCCIKSKQLKCVKTEARIINGRKNLVFQTLYLVRKDRRASFNELLLFGLIAQSVRAADS